jgi:toxin ParE1/3/4
MRIRWTVPASDDLESIKNYLQEHHPHFAQPTVRVIYERVRSLKTFPNRGTRGHRSGTRELTLTPLPYIVVYAVKADAVEILHTPSRGAGLALMLTPSRAADRPIVKRG